MNRIFLYLFLSITFSLSLFAQEKDRRAELNHSGGINEISISPDEKIFLVTSMGDIYYANNIYSSFHRSQKLTYKIEKKNKINNDYPRLDRISFFNNDTAIITGYIQSDSNEYSNQNGYYLTENRTKDCKRLCFEKKESEWIYDVFIISNGLAWMGGSSGNILFTSNFGKSWRKLNSPFDKSSRTHSIYMINANEGISGTLNNYIYITKDNWTNFKKIKTPFDQKLYKTNSQYSDNRINKIRIWKNYYIVNQDDKIFYTDRNNIVWKKFNIDLSDFEIDRQNNDFFAISNDGEVILFDDINNYKTISHQKITERILDMKVVNNSIYLLLTNYPSNSGDKIIKINKKEVYKTGLFTEDEKIEFPKEICFGNNLQWAFNENYIYITETGKFDWYREAQLDYYIQDLFLLNDSTAIVWNGKNNYIYSTSTKKDTIYYPQNPLSSFLLYPIKKIEINEGFAGDFNSRKYIVEYNLIDNMLTTTKLTKETTNKEFPDDTIFNNQVCEKELKEILQQFNNNPQNLPQLKDYNITDKDKKEYIQLLDSLFFGKRNSNYKQYKKDTVFFYNLIYNLDTISQESFNKVITKDIDIWALARIWFEINIINSNNEKIELSNKWYKPNAFYFPLTIKYKGQYINSYNLPLSLFIDKCYPFTNKFENKELLLDIATYFYHKRKY